MNSVHLANTNKLFIPHRTWFSTVQHHFFGSFCQLCDPYTIFKSKLLSLPPLFSMTSKHFYNMSANDNRYCQLNLYHVQKLKVSDLNKGNSTKTFDRSITHYWEALDTHSFVKKCGKLVEFNLPFWKKICYKIPFSCKLRFSFGRKFKCGRNH